MNKKVIIRLLTLRVNFSIMCLGETMDFSYEGGNINFTNKHYCGYLFENVNSVINALEQHGVV